MDRKQQEAYSQEAPPPYDESQPPELDPLDPKLPYSPPGYSAEGPPVYTPLSQPLYDPQGQPVYAPQGQPVYAPQGQPGYAPQGQPVYAPQGQPVYAPQGQPGYPITQQPVIVYVNQSPGLPSPPPTFLGLAIFATICCCWPIGIFAIFRASSCKNAIGRGDRVEADRFSAQAKKFSLCAIGIGVGFTVAIFAMIFAAEMM